MSDKAFVEIKNIGISFGGLHAVENFCLRQDKGTLYGLIGPNGAGKTTVFNLLSGFYKPDKGTFYLDGVNMTGKSTIELNKLGIARTFQNIRLFSNMSAFDNVKIGLHNERKYGTIHSILHSPTYVKSEVRMNDKAMELLSMFELDEDRRTLASNLPYGKQRRLEIARALASNPKYLLLDEPAAGMNPNETADLMKMIRLVRDKFDITILLIEHDMKLVSGICEKVSVLNFGQPIAFGDTAEVLKNPEVVKAYLGD